MNIFSHALFWVFIFFTSQWKKKIKEKNLKFPSPKKQKNQKKTKQKTQKVRWSRRHVEIGLYAALCEPLGSCTAGELLIPWELGKQEN